MAAQKTLIFEAALVGLVAILQRDHQAFQRPQQAEADDDGQRQEYHQMEPKRRLINQFDPEREAEHEKTRQQNDENRRTVARVGEFVIESAMVAGRREAQESVE